ncbi:uncharacterized protein MONBRDRAFT_31860 [Monosiga brevicollis MX1]|uniref:Uncharacterized protein n=1 Tax=Monosiga brevicollis TaxID=81824 RepID=A9UVV5_MONBE|nr:uncharacterized protein MONBRDRAFT_31860 [Monosiga brevicollis MX1]EDQ90655.1 predicted protein [Monosiga brevicollis MX1]|eukprot:XP_001744706.1 hypothetical protein [Monosiga brevicollis MX1]
MDRQRGLSFVTSLHAGILLRKARGNAQWRITPTKGVFCREATHTHCSKFSARSAKDRHVHGFYQARAGGVGVFFSCHKLRQSFIKPKSAWCSSDNSMRRSHICRALVALSLLVLLPLCLYAGRSLSRPAPLPFPRPNFEHLDHSLAHPLTTTRVPKILHQIWLGTETPPCDWVTTWSRDFRAAHPDWTYHLWTQSELDRLPLRNRAAYLHEEHPANKADIARYELLYHYGGVYVDADSLWLGRPLEPLLEQANATGLFFGEELRPASHPTPQQEPHMYAVGVIGAAPHHPGLELVIRNLNHSYFQLRVVERVARWQVTGPDFVTATLRQVPVTLIPAHIFYPGGWWKSDPHTTPAEARQRYPDSLMFQFGLSTSKRITRYLTDDGLWPALWPWAARPPTSTCVVSSDALSPFQSSSNP